MKIKLSEVRKIVREELAAKSQRSGAKNLNENIGFATARPKGVLPQTYEDFRKCFEASFVKLSLHGIAGKVMNLNESNSVIDVLSEMWTIVERENNSGLTGAPKPHFSEGRQFWDYFGPSFEAPLARLIESQLPGTSLAKSNTKELAKNVIDILKAGS